ncbi:MAG: hypothetical protein HN742_43505 [Lentisphaerae bacterium]|jgi:hypothetical protein|nr:hypothetical protein [Lentisphaerota bacterium]MBT4821572.1 hypothetical protein [Lentisphaerota bacterium]MBT5604562.1 hypothetical protein [Lentisphaerota bacterium]MBT7061735.1 hypothetical protein [Lentisphaerota bacterium]MBT7848807.1 hypothetical protein [Lentisphaerota bacterium]
MQSMRARVLAGIAVIVVAGFSGCRTSANRRVVGLRLKPVYMLILKGDFWEIPLDYTVAESHYAVMRGIRNLGIEPLTSRLDKVSAIVDAIFADQEFLEVHIMAIGPSKVRFKLRCGFHDEEERTKLIFRNIAAYFPDTVDVNDLPDVHFVRPFPPHEDLYPEAKKYNLRPHGR